MGYFCIPCKECIILAKLRREKRLQKLQRGQKKKKKANLTKQDLLFCFDHDHAVKLACIWGVP